MQNKSKAELGAERVLSVFASRLDRLEHGLMPHEFAARFRSDGWHTNDFKPAMEFAFKKGWVEVNAQFYRLTKHGRREWKIHSV